MIILKLAEDVQAVATQTAVTDAAGSRFRGSEAMLQVKISGTATVEVYGKIHADLAYDLIGTYTASTLESIPYLPYMYTDVTAYTSGGVWVYVGVDCRK